MLDVKILKCVFRPKDWNIRLWYICDFEEVTGVSYHTLRNHLLKLVRGGFIVRSKTVFPAYYEAVNDAEVRDKVERVFKMWVGVLLDD